MAKLDQALTIASIFSIVASAYDAHVRRKRETRADDEKDRRIRDLEERLAKIKVATRERT